MSLSDLKNELIYHKLEDRYLVLPATGATVGEAAKVLQVDPDAIAKSLVLNVNEQPTVLVLSGNARLDNHHFKEEFRVRPRLLPATEVQKATGYPVGGVNPIGLNNALPVYLDTSLKNLTWLYPAAGDEYHALKLTLTELITLSRPVRWVKVSK
ncbi:YbaK/EbsC family protein [Liquorilactobacillus satsumensis]|uniref:EbsC YbaK protein n=2 Tax=Liquorilactobacillus satsumensis TaxID=259059 RepID=A0A0R1V692_9LACO|nr:YbaK/EbsC family protein [Liquorilactobacillus satsumensis]KRL97243.1 EbsC YbaK protein [Liquorilactobacillus satsumensis DSM 16230 = JCM 12392]MCP9312191.1 YbaK/EbsC family protein [Liquorilactobacillus satsumensis]MCP9359469.1 YbaK/EbsC family protein [Liquorilactobacillus satsumensis]